MSSNITIQLPSPFMGTTWWDLDGYLACLTGKALHAAAEELGLSVKGQGRRPLSASAVRDAIRAHYVATTERKSPTAKLNVEVKATDAPLLTQALQLAENWFEQQPTEGADANDDHTMMSALMQELRWQVAEATTDRCPNDWHRSAPARRRMLCPEC